MPTQNELDSERVELQSLLKQKQKLTFKIKAQRALVRAMEKSGIDPESIRTIPNQSHTVRFPPDDGSNVQYPIPDSEAVDESIPPFLRRQK